MQGWCWWSRTATKRLRTGMTKTRAGQLSQDPPKIMTHPPISKTMQESSSRGQKREWVASFSMVDYLKILILLLKLP